MCVAIACPSNKELPMEHIRWAMINNPHGFGLAATYKDTVVIERGFSERDAKKLWRAHAGTPRVFHARIATAGDISLENTHPYDASYGTGKNKQERWLFHNGSLHMPIFNPEMSDSWHLAMLLQEFPTSADLFTALQAYAIKEDSRFALITPKGVMRFGIWKERNGIFYSNESAWDARLVKSSHISDAEWKRIREAGAAQRKENRKNHILPLSGGWNDDREVFWVDWSDNGNVCKSYHDPRTNLHGGEEWKMFLDGIIRNITRSKETAVKWMEEQASLLEGDAADQEIEDAQYEPNINDATFNNMTNEEVDIWMKKGILPKRLCAKTSDTIELDQLTWELEQDPTNKSLASRIVTLMNKMMKDSGAPEWDAQETVIMMDLVLEQAVAHAAARKAAKDASATTDTQKSDK